MPMPTYQHVCVHTHTLMHDPAQSACVGRRVGGAEGDVYSRVQAVCGPHCPYKGGEAGTK